MSGRYDSAVAATRLKLADCPTDPTAASFHHAAAKKDAATGAPTTAEGQALLASRRPWPGLGWAAECVCGSTLVIPYSFDLFDARIPDRIWARVQPEPNSGCWLWIGALGVRDYGALWDPAIAGHRRSIAAHRYFYGTLCDEPPPGTELDHLCRTHSCVNPAHLEPVTHAVNCQRGLSGAEQRARTHCPKGHPYDEANTFRMAGERRCRLCYRATRQRYYRRSQRGAPPAPTTTTP